MPIFPIVCLKYLKDFQKLSTGSEVGFLLGILCYHLMKSYLTDAESELIQKRIDGLCIYSSDHLLLTLEQEIYEGNLHLRKGVKSDYKPSKRNDTLLKNKSKNMLGMYVLKVEEPNAFINPNVILYLNLHWNESNTHSIIGTEDKAMIHEATHAVTSGMPRFETIVEQCLDNNYRKNSDNTLDDPKEIFERIMELRYSANINPDHLFTIRATASKFQ